MQREAFAQDEGPSQAGSEDEKPTPAEQEAMLKQWQENWDTAPVPRNQAEEIEAQWEACTTYSAMLQLNRDYLHGRLPRTPYMGNLDPETAPLLSGLLQLHDYGLLTVQSQPNEHTDPHFRPAFQHSPEGWYEFRQRAFLDFLMPTDGTIPIEQVKHFCLSLAEHPDIDTQIGVELSHTLKYGKTLSGLISDLGYGSLRCEACCKSRLFSRYRNADSRKCQVILRSRLLLLPTTIE